ncbi:MAG: DMT family transporter [Eubacteriales bacterium]
MNTKKLVSSSLLFVTACIWGVAFVAQSMGMDHIGPFTFNFVRTLIGAIVLIPVIFLFSDKKLEQSEEEKKSYRYHTWVGGICCGVALCIATSFQQFGIMYTTVGKAGFITALYIIIVPILGLFLKKKVRLLIWISAGIAVVGFYLLCVMGQFELNIGDLLILICALVFSIHILIIDYFSPRGNGVQISAIQFAVTAFLCGIGALIFETIVWEDICNAWLPILYAGVMSCGVAYTLQIIGQKNTEPAVASLILSLEAVVSVIAGAIILHERMSVQELVGCGLVFLAIILAQLPEKKA